MEKISQMISESPERRPGDTASWRGPLVQSRYATTAFISADEQVVRAKESANALVKGAGRAVHSIEFRVQISDFGFANIRTRMQI